MRNAHKLWECDWALTPFSKFFSSYCGSLKDMADGPERGGWEGIGRVQPKERQYMTNEVSTCLIWQGYDDMHGYDVSCQVFSFGLHETQCFGLC